MVEEGIQQSAIPSPCSAPPNPSTLPQSHTAKSDGEKRRRSLIVTAFITLSLLLCIATAALWITRCLGYHWTARFAPYDGPSWSIRDNPRGSARMIITRSASWPHPGLSGAWVSRTVAGPAIWPRIPLGIDPLQSHVLAHWQFCGVSFQYVQFFILIDMTEPDPRVTDALVRHQQPVNTWTLNIPYWIPFTLFAMPCLVPLARRCTRRFRPSPDLCPGCH